MRKTLLLSLLMVLTASAAGGQTVRIWEGTKVHARSVTLTAFLPEGGFDTAVIVCPGGSYFWHDMEAEGSSVAEWLSANGIAAFVLKYRVGGVGDFLTGSRFISHRRRHPDMIQDLQRSIRMVREGYAPKRLGVMGFSAGGHLAMSGAVFAGTDFTVPAGLSSPVPLRPDFVAPVYPVVTMSDGRYVHKRSRFEFARRLFADLD